MPSTHAPGEAFSSLRWRGGANLSSFSLTAMNERLSLGGSSLSDLADLTGVPVWDQTTEPTPKQKAIWLLHAAAEVEHQFIIQYLYALYCGAPDDTLMTIAQEEMGHLVTVQNLLLTVRKVMQVRPVQSYHEICEDTDVQRYWRNGVRPGWRGCWKAGGPRKSRRCST